MMQKIKVMFVCLGNICRSPLAHALMQQKVHEMNMADQLLVDSSGTASYHTGEDADPRTHEVASRHGVPMTHTAKTLSSQHLDRYDHIVVMDEQNLSDVKRLDQGEYAFHLHKMRDFDPEGRGSDVPDPWFGEADGFEEVFQILERSCNGLMTYLMNEINEKK